MTILVTGATGYLGGHVVEALVEAGRDVRALVRRDVAEAKLAAFESRFPTVRIARGDLLDERSLAEAVRDVEGLVHCAARLGYWSRQDAVQHRINVDGTVHLLRQARKKRVARMVHVSSVACVGCNRDGTPLTEDAPWVGQHRPRVNYVATKREAEERAFAAAAAGAPVIVVNPAVMLGPRVLDPTHRPLLARAMAAKARVPRGGSSVAHVRDVADGIRFALERGRSGERYILGGENVTWRGLSTAIAERCGVAPPRAEYPLVLGRALERGATLLDLLHLSRPRWAPELFRMWGWFTCADSGKARAELGYAPATLDETLRRSL